MQNLREKGIRTRGLPRDDVRSRFPQSKSTKKNLSHEIAPFFFFFCGDDVRAHDSHRRQGNRAIENCIQKMYHSKYVYLFSRRFLKTDPKNIKGPKEPKVIGFPWVFLFGFSNSLKIHSFVKGSHLCCKRRKLLCFHCCFFFCNG